MRFDRTFQESSELDPRVQLLDGSPTAFTSGLHSAPWTDSRGQWGVVGLGGVAWLPERQRTLAVAPPKAAAPPLPDKLGKGPQPA